MKRRFFFRNIALSAAGFYLLPAFQYAGENSSGQEISDMDKLFLNPPDSYKPWVMWTWMNGHITREGITLDLEMMKSSGFRGAFCLRFNSGIPEGPVKSGSQAWLDVTKHAIREAERLGLELVFQLFPVIQDGKNPMIPEEYKRQKLVWSEIVIPANKKIQVKLPLPVQKPGFYRDISVLAYPAPVTEKQIFVDPESVVDVTSFVNRKGWLKWETAVPGNLTIVRIGHTLEEKEPDMDFFRKEAMNWVFENMSSNPDPYPTGQSLKGFFGLTRHSDPGGWSIAIGQAFSDRLKYSIFPWLLILTGKVVGSQSKSDRFLHDFRKIQKQLYSENFEKRWSEWCHQKGVKWFSIPASLMDTEILSSGDLPANPDFNRITEGNDSLSVNSASSPRCDSPGELKFNSDILYSLGAGSLIISPFFHQPYLTGVPGISTTYSGMALGRNNAWSEGLPGLTNYLGRTQFLMQQGSPVADFCIFRGDLLSDDSTKVFPFLPAEFSFEFIERNNLALCTIEDGKIKHPGGNISHLCVLAPSATLFPETLKLLAELVEKGMILITGQKPVISMGLSDSEEETAKLSDLLFGNPDRVANGKPDPGKGKVYHGVQVQEIPDLLSVPADFRFSSEIQNASIRFSHRKAGESHIYFLFNSRNRTERISCSFRISHLEPEIWNCETGEMFPAPIHNVKAGRLRMPLKIPPLGSVFIVFRNKYKNAVFNKVTLDGKLFLDNEPLKFRGLSPYTEGMENHGLDIPDMSSKSPLTFHSRHDGSLSGLFQQNGVYDFQVYNENVGENLTVYVENCFSAPLDSSWVVHFPDGSGAPREIVPDKLESLSRHPDFNIRHFSGTCRYSTIFYLADSDFISSRRFLLDLGTVATIAKISINGTDAGLLWKQPFIADITPFVKKGENILKLEVTNSWHNRLTGDESLPPENEYDRDGTIIKLPDWYIGNLPKTGDRKTFMVRKSVSKDEPLSDSGLLGPVKLIFCEERFL
jgi:hypothetical protein